MENEKIKKMLEYRFNLVVEFPKKRRIIFWYDDKKEFKEIINDLNLENVKILTIDKGTNRRGDVINTNLFKIKYTLEYLDPNSNYLIYSEYPKPADNENYLIDIEKYSEYFVADKSALIIEELGLDRLNYSLIEVIKNNMDFFANKERKEKLLKILKELDKVDARDLKLSILAVSVGVKNIDICEIIKAILIDRKKIDFVNKWIGQDFLYEQIKLRFNIEVDNFDKFIKIILVTNLYAELQEDTHKNLDKYYMGRVNEIYFFVNSMLQNKQVSKKIREIFEEFGKELEIEKRISELNPDVIAQGISFEDFDKNMIRYLLENIKSEVIDYEKYSEYINMRLDNSLWKDKYKTYYKMLISIIKLYSIKENFFIKEREELSQIFKDYTENYYKIDRLYRDFYYYYDNIKNSGELDSKDTLILNQIEQKISYFYEREYLEELLSLWAENMDSRFNILQQKDFYKIFIEPNDVRTAVIISDGLRFEVGKEIAEKARREINSKDINLRGMLTSLPSITSVGMLNLLPDIDRVCDPFNKKFSVSGINTYSTENREKILKLSVAESSAIQFYNFKNMARGEQENYIKGKKVIYIYHDAIDQTGDKPKGETETFEVCKKAVDGILGMMKLLSSLGIVNIFVTSDHGFLYERKIIEEYNKLELDENILVEGKRYGFSDKFIEENGCTTVKFDNFYGIFPTKNQRIKKNGGGLQFVHGGISPQEMIVPLIQFVGGVNSKKIEKVGVKIRENIRKITSNITKFSIYQLDGVSSKVKIKEREIVACLYDGDIKVSNEVKMRLNSIEENTQYDFRLTLSGEHDTVTLKIMDLETENILDSKEYSVNIGIISEFD